MRIHRIASVVAVGGFVALGLRASGNADAGSFSSTLTFTTAPPPT